MIHDTYTGPSFVLSLTEIKKWDDSSLLVLWRIVRNDLLCTFEILRREFKGNLTGQVTRKCATVTLVLTFGLLYSVSRCCNEYECTRQPKFRAPNLKERTRFPKYRGGDSFLDSRAAQSRQTTRYPREHFQNSS
jgi:hypothetical protein